MYEILEIKYNKDTLQTYINKKYHTFLGFSEGLMVFKVKRISKKSTSLMIDKTLLDLIKTLNIEDFKEFGTEEHLKLVMKDLYIYWSARNDGEEKERWQMEKVFDIRSRYYTFLRRAKKDTPKKSATITTFG